MAKTAKKVVAAPKAAAKSRKPAAKKAKVLTMKLPFRFPVNRWPKWHIASGWNAAVRTDTTKRTGSAPSNCSAAKPLKRLRSKKQAPARVGQALE